MTFKVKDGISIAGTTFVDGSRNISIGTLNGNTPIHSGNYSSYAAPTSHTHDYLPLSGGTLTGTLTVNTGDGVRIFKDGGSGLVSHLYWANANNNRAYNWQLDENSSATMWGYGGSAWTKLLTITSAGALNAVSAITQNGSQVLHAGNYGSYALPLSGGTVSGYTTFSADVNMTSGNSYLPGHFYTNTWDGSNVYFHVGGPGSTTNKILNLRVMNSSGGNSLYNFNVDRLDAPNLTVNGNQVLHAGNYGSYAVSNTSRVKTFFIEPIGASGTQAKRFEIARIAIDYNDWNAVGPFEVELFGTYFASGLKKRYIVNYGYGGINNLQLVEMIGNDDNNFRVAIGSPVQVSGDHYYLPVYVDVRYYSACAVRITTARQISGSNPPPIGSAYVYSAPSGANISDFSADSTVNLSHSASAWQVGGNTLLHGSNYSSYALPLSGGTLSGTLSFQQPVGLGFANGQQIKDNGSGGLLISSGAAVNINGTSVTINGNTALHAGNSQDYKARSLNAVRTTNTDFNSLSAAVDTFTAGTNYIPSGGSYNQPIAGDHHYLAWGGIEGQSVWAAQFDIDFYSDRVWFRRQYNSTWQGWREFIHDGNYNSYAPTLTGGNASGTWGINITGSANTANSASNSNTVGGIAPAQFFNNMGNNHSTYTDFNNVPGFGTYYVQQGNNGPTGVAANQFYGFTLGLGNDYALSSYGTQLYWPRRAQNGDTYIYIRDREGSSWTSWTKVKAGYADTAGSATDSSKLPLSGGTLTGTTQLYAGTAGYSPVLIFGGEAGAPYSYKAIYSDAYWLTFQGHVNEGMRFKLSNGTGITTYSTLTTSYLDHGVSLRTPIFYDLDDTGYYVNLNSTSDAALRIRGGALHGPNPTWGAYLLVGGDGRQNYTDTSFASVCATNGNLHIDSGSGYTTHINWYDGGDLLVGIGNSSTLGFAVYGANNYSFARGSMRAPVFYDSDDTTYYTDPGGATNIKHLRVNGNWGDYGEPWNGQITIRGGYPSMQFRSSTTNSVWLRHMDGAGDVQHYYGSGGIDTNSWSIRHTMTTGGSFSSIADHRAPIFYDRDNTNYYTDPASWSYLNYISLANHIDIYGPMYSYKNDVGYIVQSFNTSASNAAQFNIRHSYGNTVIEAQRGSLYLYGSSTEANNSLRAPIFYDNNDTGYYTNPNGTSNLNTVISQGYFCGGGNGYGWYKGYDNNNHFISIRGAVSGTTTSLSITGAHQTTLVEHCSPADTTTGWFFKDSYSGGNYNYNTVARISRNNSWFEGALYGDSSVRSPIFYDNNDTAFYCDPASFTYLGNGIANSGAHGSSYIYNRLLSSNNGANEGEVRVQMWCSEPGNTWSYGGFGYNVDNTSNSNSPVYFFGRPNPNFGQAYMRFSTGGEWYFYNTNTTPTRFLTMQLTSSGYVIAYQSMRSPIFYDQDDTSYFADLNSTSTSIRAAGNITAYYSDMRLKTHLGKIENARDKVRQLEGFYYEANELAQSFGYKAKREVGVSAQAVQAVLPEIVTDAPINSNYLTIDYERLTPLLIEAFKEQDQEVISLKAQISQQQSELEELKSLVKSLLASR